MSESGSPGSTNGSSSGPKKISFGLGSALKPGFSKPKPISLDQHLPDGGGDGGGKPAAGPLVIPIKEADRIIRPAQTPPQDLAKFEPAKYGLQVRKKVQPTTVLHTPAPSTAMDEDLPRPPSRARRSEEEQLKADLGRLPDEPGKRMYEAVPVEDFGVALLKGMGWTGSTDKTTTSAPGKQVRRPERLGLGAKEGQPMTRRADYLGTKQTGAGGKPAEQAIKVASRVSVKEGSHAGRTGEVIEFISTGIASVKLRNHPHLVQLQTSKLALLGETQSTDEDEVRIAGAWPGAVVRIACRAVADGKLFHRTAAILDSHHQGDAAILCSLKAADGTLLHDIPITCLSPHIPATKLPCRVVILGGEHAGQRGVLLQLSDSHVGTVQLEDDHSVLLTLPLSSFTLAA